MEEIIRKHAIIVTKRLLLSEKLSLTLKFPQQGFQFLFCDQEDSEAFLLSLGPRLEEKGINGRIMILDEVPEKVSKGLDLYLETDLPLVSEIDFETLRKGETMVVRDKESFLDFIGKNNSVDKPSGKSSGSKVWNKSYGILFVIIVVVILLLCMFGWNSYFLYLFVFLILVGGLYWVFMCQEK